MSRIGNSPVAIPNGVSIDIEGSLVKISGGNDTLEFSLPPGIKINISDATLTVLSNKNNPLVEVRFSDCFPVALSGLDYTQQVADVEYLTATVDFRYKLYEIVTL